MPDPPFCAPGANHLPVDLVEAPTRRGRKPGRLEPQPPHVGTTSGVEPGKEQQAEAAILAELEGLKNGPITQEEMDDCRRGLLSSMDALSDSLAALEGWYYGQITRGEPLYPPEYRKVLTGAVTLDEVRQALQSYSYSVCYDVTAKPGTAGKGGAEDV